MGFAALNPSYRLRLNLLAKIGLLWYEINDFSNAQEPTALRTVPSPKLIGTGRLVLVKTKPAVFYCQMRQAELENPCSQGIDIPARRVGVPQHRRNSALSSPKADRNKPSR